MRRRNDDAAKVFFRSGRFFFAGGSWFVLTRGGGQIGPFGSRRDAGIELDFWLRDTGAANHGSGSFGHFFG